MVIYTEQTLNKALLRNHLGGVADDSELIIDGSKALFIDQDILETIAEYLIAAPERNIDVELQGFAGDSPLHETRLAFMPRLASAGGHA